jgi:hypothetical protein
VGEANLYDILCEPHGEAAPYLGSMKGRIIFIVAAIVLVLVAIISGTKGWEGIKKNNEALKEGRK